MEKKETDFDMQQHIFECCIGWRKYLEYAQDVLRELGQECAEDIPDELYLKKLLIVNHCLKNILRR